MENKEVTPEASVDTKSTIDTTKATTVAHKGETSAKKAQKAAGVSPEIKPAFRTETVGLTNQKPEAPVAAATLAEKGEGKELVDQRESKDKTGELTQAEIDERQAVVEGKLRLPNNQNRNYLD